MVPSSKTNENDVHDLSSGEEAEDNIGNDYEKSSMKSKTKEEIIENQKDKAENGKRHEKEATKKRDTMRNTCHL